MNSLSADDAFLTHYGFSHDPFAARAPGFKFFPAQRKPVLGQLHHLARYSQLLLLVTGPEGSGKTLLRQALVASSNKQAVQSVVVTPQSTMDASALLAQIAQALNSQDADFDGIMAQVVQLALTGQEVYLLVDDAERLTGAAVETLLRLAAGTPEARPHVFLFGEPALAGRLEALSEGEERHHAIALQPYEEDETREYLALRLEGAGSGIECLNEEQIARIHDQSGGWPGAINQVARDELLAAMQSSRGRRKSTGMALPLPKKHLLAALAVIVVVAIGFLVLRGGEGERSVAPQATQLPLDAPAGSSAASSEQGGQTAIEFDAEERPLSLPLGGDAQPVIREPLAAAAGGEDDAEVALPGARESTIPAPAPAPAPSLLRLLQRCRRRRRHRRLLRHRRRCGRMSPSVRQRLLLRPALQAIGLGMPVSRAATIWSRSSGHVSKRMPKRSFSSTAPAIATSPGRPRARRSTASPTAIRPSARQRWKRRSRCPLRSRPASRGYEVPPASSRNWRQLDKKCPKKVRNALFWGLQK